MKLCLACLVALIAQFSLTKASAATFVHSSEEWQLFAAVTGERVAWFQAPFGPGQQQRIVSLDLVTQGLMTLSQGLWAHQGPAFANNNVVAWSDNRNGDFDVWGYDLTTRQEFSISQATGRQVIVSAGGNMVVWQDERDSPDPSFPVRDIYGYDLTARREIAICTNGADQIAPAASGRYVVWQDGRNRFWREWDIYGYDLLTGTEFPICTAVYQQGEPVVSGNYVVWTDHRDTPGSDIWGLDLSTGREFPICTAPRWQSQPAIDGNLVVWLDFRADMGGGEIYGYDLSTGLEFPISVGGPYRRGHPAVSGNTVVWHWYQDGKYQVWMETVPEPGCCLVLLAAAPLCLRRRRPA